MNKIITGLVIALVAVLVIFGVYKHSHSDIVGASGQPYSGSMTQLINGLQVGGGPYNQGLVQSGINSTSTTVTAYTLVANDLIGYAEMHISPNLGSLSLQLPATSTLPATFLPNAGDQEQFILYNATTTTGIFLALSPGVGSLLEIASSTGATLATSSTTPSRAMSVTVFRKVNTDLVWMAQRYE